MRWAVLTVAVGLAALVPTVDVAAQGLPPGGYYAGGAYYVPSEPPAAAAAQGPFACPLGSAVPTVYVANTPTMVRIQWFWPSGGGSAPGFPYVPAYVPPAAC